MFSPEIKAQLEENLKKFNEAREKELQLKKIEEAEEKERAEKRALAMKPSKSSYIGFHPSVIVDELNKVVIKQEAAKKEIALTLSHSLLRYFNKFFLKSPTKIDKKTLLLTGDTGVGKTLLVKTACEILDIPLLILDCASWTAEGWAGKNIRDYFMDFFKVIEEKAEARDTSFEVILAQSVIFLDEFDKLSMNLSSDHNKDAHYSKQFNLLKLIEGTTIDLDRKSQKQIDISDVTFILGGSFHEFSEEKDKHKPIGFNTQMDEKISEMNRSTFLKEAGIISELAGRITTVVNLTNLDVSDYVNILKNGKNSIITQYEELFALYDKKLVLSEKDVLEIAEKAATLKIGARGLNSTFVEFINEKFYKIDEIVDEPNPLMRSN